MSAQNKNSGLDQELDLKSFKKLSDAKIQSAKSGTACISIKHDRKEMDFFFFFTLPNSESTACYEKNTSLSFLRVSKKCQTHSKRQTPHPLFLSENGIKYGQKEKLNSLSERQGCQQLSDGERLQ